MSTITTDTTLISSSTDTAYTSALKSAMSSDNQSLMSSGISALYAYMDTLTSLGNTEFAKMQSESDIASEAQTMANEVDEVYANASLDGDSGTGTLPDDVVTYMTDNGVTVDGMTISEYISANQTDSSGTLSLGSLKAVESALSTLSTSASDTISSDQLQIQQSLQTYNVTVTLINSMQTMLEEMNKSIAQNMS